MNSYEHFRRARAFAKTRRDWNFHQTASLVVPPALGLVLTVGVKEWRREVAVMDLATVELAAFCIVASYVVLWLLSLAANYIWAAPAELHAEQAAAIRQLESAARVAARERPYVSIDGADFVHKSFGLDAQIAFTLANAGAAPARSVRADVELRFPGRDPRSVSTPEATALFPGTSQVLSFDLASEEVQHIASVWEFSVTVRYEGAADRRYLTSATFRYQGVLRGFVMSAGEFE